jgi:hypothetical protein
VNAPVPESVDVACVGDTVFVGPGTFPENVTIDKALTLLGQPGCSTASANVDPTPIAALPPACVLQVPF